MNIFGKEIDIFHVRRLSEVDVLVVACLVVAVFTALATAIIPHTREKSSAITEVPMYYPVETAVPHEQASTPIKTANSGKSNFTKSIKLPPLKPVKQLDRSNPGFITLLGDGRLEAHFAPTKTNGLRGTYGGRWAPENLVSTADGTKLLVRKENSAEIPFSIAEAASREHYGYGRYEVVMQIGKGSGLVSAFFTYTGPWFGNPHDEIDIEFLGKDPSTVLFNYWKNGKRGSFATFDLPFDASAAPHLYAFEWLPDKITWYVDGEAFYATPENDPGIPSTAGRVFFSHWTGIPKMSAWHGKPTFESDASALVNCVSFTPVGENTRSCSDIYHSDHNG